MSATASDHRERGTAPHRFEFHVEPEEGTPADNPNWQPITGNMETAWDGEPDANTEARRGVGATSPRAFFNGPETHEYDFTYDLTQWFVDAAGDTVDPSHDAMRRASDGAQAATHTVVGREDHHFGGADGAGYRIYKVGKGGNPGSLDLPFETDDGLPIALALSYQFEKFREYVLHQPAASTLIAVQSTDPADDTQTLTLEDEGAATVSDVALNGDTPVTTEVEFDNLDAAELDAETQGDIEIYVNDEADPTLAPVLGTQLSTLPGATSYDVDEGDLGIPALGTGTHATMPDPKADAISFNGTSLTTSDPEFEIVELTGGEASIDQGLDDQNTDEPVRKNIHPTDTEITVTISMAGPTVTVDATREHLQGNETDIVWEAPEGTITFETGRVMSPGSVDDETSTQKKVVDVEYEVTGITVVAA